MGPVRAADWPRGGRASFLEGALPLFFFTASFSRAPSCKCPADSYTWRGEAGGQVRASIGPTRQPVEIRKAPERVVAGALARNHCRPREGPHLRADPPARRPANAGGGSRP